MNARTKTLRMPGWHLVSSRTLFVALATLLLAVFVLYVYLVNKTVMNVVAREKIERDIAARSTSLSALEYKYITLKNNVTLPLAYQKGFKDATPASFISSGSKTLTYNSR